MSVENRIPGRIPPSFTIVINRKKYELTEEKQTGASLKRIAGIAPEDALYLEGGKEDLLVRNEDRIIVRPGSVFHSQPPADYGKLDVTDLGVEGSVRADPQPDGSTVLIVDPFELPPSYAPRTVRLLLRVPALFPEARPDMFWVSPRVHTAAGAAPAGTGDEAVNGETWQRFSWHLKEGAWDPRHHTMRDFMRCVRARFERGN